MKKVLIYLFFLIINLTLKAQDIHQRDPKPVEQLIYEKNPNQAKAIFNREKYLVLENLRKNKRTRFYVGDYFSCQTKENFIFEDQIHAIHDSSIVMAVLNEVGNRYELVDVKITEISHIFVRPKRPIRLNFMTFAPLSYLVFEWANWRVNPLENPKLPLALGLTAAQPALELLGNKTRKKKLTENFRLRVFQAF